MTELPKVAIVTVDNARLADELRDYLATCSPATIQVERFAMNSEYLYSLVAITARKLAASRRNKLTHIAQGFCAGWRAR